MRSLRAAILALVATSMLAGSAHGADVAACVDAATRGQQVRDHGDLVAAQRDFVSCAQADCPDAVAAACAGWLEDVERRTPTAVFRVRDGSDRDRTDVIVRVDGTPLQDGLTGLPTRMNPGRHVVRFEANDGRFVERELLMAEGEKARLVLVDWPAPETRPRPVATTTSSALPTSFWLLGGLAVGALGAASYLGLSGFSEAGSLRDSCGPRCPESDRDGVARTLLFADVALGVGLVALGAAAYIALSRPTAPAPR